MRPVDADVMSLLREWKLVDEAERLAANGVCEMEDLEFMTAKDVQKFGLRLKFRGLLQHVPRGQGEGVENFRREPGARCRAIVSGSASKQEGETEYDDLFGQKKDSGQNGLPPCRPAPRHRGPAARERPHPRRLQHPEWVGVCSEGLIVLVCLKAHEYNAIL